MKEEQLKSATRREFLTKAGLGAGAVGAVATLAAGTAQAKQPDESPGVGYRETDHVRKVYDLARF